jgi:mannose-6-phosphate isomerase-like protein (cupin superfamily)
MTPEPKTPALPWPAFATLALPRAADAVAPDGSQVRVLLARAGGSMAHFSLPPGAVSKAVVHRSVEEIWYVVGGRGAMWRRDAAGVEAVTPLAPGVCLTIPLGTCFQFRADPVAEGGAEPLAAVGITMPPWPGPDEALPVDGPWAPTVGG